MTEISFVIPVHNEEQSLEKVYALITEVCEKEQYDYEIIFVDDGSTDNSMNIIEKLSRQNVHVLGIQFRRNFGQTAAMSAGIHTSTKALIVTLDADLQNDPTDVPRLIAKLDEGYDIVSGVRTDRKDAYFRKLPSRCANKIISKISGVKLTDYGCTIKVYRSEYLKGITLYGDMHRFIPIFAAWYGAKVTEVPVRHHAREYGHSHYGIFGRTGRVLLDLITVKFLHTFITRPMHFFGSIGIMFMGTGLMCGIVSGALKVMDIRDFVSTPLPLVTIFLISIGIQALLLGLLGELLIRIYFEQAGHKSYRIYRTTEDSKQQS